MIPMEPFYTLSEAAPQSGISIAQILTLIGAVVSALATAVGFLFKSLHSSMKAGETRLQEKLDQCEVKHEESNDKLLEVSTEMGELRGKIAGLEGMNQLAENVLKAIKEKEER